MRERGHTIACMLYLLLALWLGAGRVFAVVVLDGSTYDATNGWYVYNYSLENPSTATDQLYWLELRGLSGGDALDTAPVGWIGWLLGHDIDWIADPGFEVAPGGTLADFSLHSSRGPGGWLEYEAFGDVDSEYTGRVEGPSLVPEPSLGLLLLAGMVPLGVICRRRLTGE